MNIAVRAASIGWLLATAPGAEAQDPRSTFTVGTATAQRDQNVHGVLKRRPARTPVSFVPYHR